MMDQVPFFFMFRYPQRYDHVSSSHEAPFPLPMRSAHPSKPILQFLKATEGWKKFRGFFLAGEKRTKSRNSELRSGVLPLQNRANSASSGQKTRQAYYRYLKENPDKTENPCFENIEPF